MDSAISFGVFLLLAGLVAAASWRLLAPQNSMAGAAASVLFFSLHPAFRIFSPGGSIWDALFVMIFCVVWLWTEHWSLFMRSWCLAVLLAGGLWIGSSFVFWGMIAMVPWVLFNRRPLAAMASMMTILMGGVVLYLAVYFATLFSLPDFGRTVFSSWIRWSRWTAPPVHSWPWSLLVFGAVVERMKDMVQARRADASTFMATLVLFSAILGSESLQLGVLALSAPLVARWVVKRDFLFHRGVRWAGLAAFGVVTLLILAGKNSSWAILLGGALIGLGSRWVKATSRLPRLLSFQAVLLGAYAAESLGSLGRFFLR